MYNVQGLNILLIVGSSIFFPSNYVEALAQI